MGSDLIPSLRQWHEGDKLIDEIKFVLFNRSGYDIQQLLQTSNMPKNYIYNSEAKNLFGEISSTEVRSRVGKARKDGSHNYLNICGLVTKGVIDYIIKNELY